MSSVLPPPHPRPPSHPPCTSSVDSNTFLRHLLHLPPPPPQPSTYTHTLSTPHVLPSLPTPHVLPLPPIQPPSLSWVPFPFQLFAVYNNNKLSTFLIYLLALHKLYTVETCLCDQLWDDGLVICQTRCQSLCGVNLGVRLHMYFTGQTCISQIRLHLFHRSEFTFRKSDFTYFTDWSSQIRVHIFHR